MRFLNTLQLEVDRRVPWLCEAATVDTRTLDFAFIYPEQEHFRIPLADETERTPAVHEVALPERALDVRVRYQVEPHRLQITAVIANRSGQPLSFSAAPWELGVVALGFLPARVPLARGPVPIVPIPRLA